MNIIRGKVNAFNALLWGRTKHIIYIVIKRDFVVQILFIPPDLPMRRANHNVILTNISICMLVYSSAHHIAYITRHARCSLIKGLCATVPRQLNVLRGWVIKLFVYAVHPENVVSKWFDIISLNLAVKTFKKFKKEIWTCFNSALILSLLHWLSLV